MLASAERFASLHLELSKKLLADQAATTKALVELKIRRPCWNIKPAWHNRASTKAFSVARSVYDAALQTQTDIQSFVEEQVLEFNKQLCANLDKVSKNAPAGSGVAISTVKNMLTSATAAYDNVTRTAKRVGTRNWQKPALKPPPTRPGPPAPPWLARRRRQEVVKAGPAESGCGAVSHRRRAP